MPIGVISGGPRPCGSDRLPPLRQALYAHLDHEIARAFGHQVALAIADLALEPDRLLR